jgi:uncharacterized membrane protein
MPCHEWVFKRNCAMSPKQLGLALGFLALISVAVAGGFWWVGVKWVVFFTAVEWIALLSATWWYLRHASDRERVVVEANRLLVEHEIAGAVHRLTFGPIGLEIQAPCKEQPLVRILGPGQATSVGRHIRPEGRHQLAVQLRQWLSKIPVRTESVGRQSVMI